MKRLFSLLLALLLTMGLLGSLPVAFAAPVVLQFWGAIPPENGPAELVENWNAEHPDIQVEYTRFVNDDAGNTRLETAVMAGEVDVFINYLASTLEKRWEAGMMASLDDYIAANNIVLEEMFGESNYYRDDTCYFIPTLGGDNAFLIYNKDMTDAAGITLPTDSWTWEAFEEAARKLTTGEGNDKVFGASMGGTIANDDWAWSAQMQYGGDFYYKSATESNFDDPLFLLGLSSRYRMEAVEKTMVSRFDIKVSNMDVASEFANGKIAMLLANQHVRDMKNLEAYPHDFMISFAPFPTPEGQEKVYSGGLREWISIYSGSEYKDEAWQFLMYYATEGYYPMCRSSRFPAWKDADPQKCIDLYLGENGAELFDLDAFEKVVVNNPRHVDNVNILTAAKSEINALMGEAFERVLLGEATPEEALADLKTQADRLIQSK